MPIKKILLLDIENIHKTESELLKLLKTYHHVYLVYAKSPVMLSLDALMKLSPFVMENRLIVMKMPKIGKDAADFGLAFIAGQLSMRFDKKDVLFDVMSNDHALEYIVDLLKMMGFQATQSKTLVDPKIEKTSSIKVVLPTLDELQTKPHLQRVKQYCDYLKKCQQNKPSKITALQNSVKAFFKFESDHTVNDLINLFKKSNILTQQAQSIEYCMATLDAWASIDLKLLKPHVAEPALTQENSHKNQSNGLVELPKDSTQKIIVSPKELEAIRLRLAQRLNVASHLRPKYLAGFTLLLQQKFPHLPVDDLLSQLADQAWITIDQRTIHYSPRLLMP